MLAVILLAYIPYRSRAIELPVFASVISLQRTISLMWHAIIL